MGRVNGQLLGLAGFSLTGPVAGGVALDLWAFFPVGFSPTVFACGSRSFRFGRDRTVAETAIGPSSTTKTINSVDLFTFYGTVSFNLIVSPF